MGDMQKLMICVKEVGKNKVEIGVFEEETNDGTKLEESHIQKLISGLKVVIDETGLLDAAILKGVSLEDPHTSLAVAIRARFNRGEA